MKNSKPNRRSFIKNSMLTLAAFVSTPLFAKNKNLKSGNTVKMLTADGRLVEVDSETIKKAPRKKVNSREILNWRTLKG